MKDTIKRRKRAQRSETQISQGSPILFYSGIAIFVVGLTLWIIEMGNRYRYGYMGFWIAFIIMVIGLVIVYVATRKNILSRNYREYYDMIYQNEIFSITELSKYADKDRTQVISELQTLVKLGYLKNIRVSETEDTITGAFVNSVKERIKRKTIRCRGCGATNEVVEHETRECEYCGRKLVFEEH